MHRTFRWLGRTAEPLNQYQSTIVIPGDRRIFESGGRK
jgi:hypothetical protein